jgi:hypothetical protein
MQKEKAWNKKLKRVSVPVTITRFTCIKTLKNCFSLFDLQIMNDLIQNKDILKTLVPVKQKCVQKTVWIMDNVSDYPITKKSLEELDIKIKKTIKKKKEKI